MAFTNTAGGFEGGGGGGGGGSCEPPNGGPRGRTLNIKYWILNGNLREVSNCDKSTGLEYSSNDNYIKKRHWMEISTKKYHIWDWVSKFNSSGQKCLEFLQIKYLMGNGRIANINYKL